MKKIDWFIVKSFVGPFILIFFITLFVLIMQFLWKYLDDLVGKGLEWYVICQLLFYASASFVPMALPLAMLLSSMMTIGTMAENYELTALKSGGTSLFRILRPLLFVSFIISIGALAFSNYLLPAANLKFGSLMYDIRQQRPALNFKPGVFNEDIDGYSIRVGGKGADNQTINQVLIYDHTQPLGVTNIYAANSGKMSTTDDKRFLILELIDGTINQDDSRNQNTDRKYEQTRVSFKTWKKVFDLSEFSLTRTRESLFKDNYQMLNVFQLNKAIDTFNVQVKDKYKEFNNYLKPYFIFMRVNADSLKKKSTPMQIKTANSIQDTISPNEQVAIYQRAINNVRNVKGYASIIANDINVKRDLIVRHKVEWHRKFTLSLACFLLFFIGAPLGAIIRKGGFGLPFIVSIFFFIAYYFITISGEKFALKFVMSPFEGMWLSVLILFPLGLFLTYKASSDSALLNLDAYKAFFRRLFRKRSKSAQPA